MKKFLVGVLIAFSFSLVLSGISTAKIALVNADWEDGDLYFYYGSQKIFWIRTGNNGVRIGDDLKFSFGDDDDAYVEYDEDGNDDLRLTAPGLRILPTADDKVLYIGESAVTQKSFDVKWFGNTSGDTVLFDASASKIINSGISQDYGDNDKVSFGAGTDLQIYSDGSNGIISGSTVKLYGEVFTTQVRIGSIAAGTDDERPVFVAPFDCELTQVNLVNATAIATDDTNYTTITIRDKGADGTADNQIASLATNSDAFSAMDAKSMGTLDATHKLLTAGDVVSFKKADSGTGQAIDEMLVMISYKRR